MEGTASPNPKSGSAPACWFSGSGDGGGGRFAGSGDGGGGRFDIGFFMVLRMFSVFLDMNVVISSCYHLSDLIVEMVGVLLR
ncbi:hypothetical protein Tco_1039807 [Tanacetum coccineum]